MRKQVFDKKEKSILELDKLFERIGKNVPVDGDKKLLKKLRHSANYSEIEPGVFKNQFVKINYIELPSTSIQATKIFFIQVFDWQFEDFGLDYTAFSNAGIDGGFFKSKTASCVKNGAALIVFYSQNIEDTQSKIEMANGRINKKIFTFPGGRRFHFIEPGGNEFAVWSDK
ncbi:Glyoxalase family protein [uncultured Candidatus Thioglobus sp.]|nr:Glyoxalase family protein [uncultured Candidatus Thioglobus sp.]